MEGERKGEEGERRGLKLGSIIGDCRNVCIRLWQQMKGLNAELKGFVSEMKVCQLTACCRWEACLKSMACLLPAWTSQSESLGKRRQGGDGEEGWG